MTLQKSALIFLIVGMFSSLSAQTFPISLTSQAAPPHTTNLADLTSPGSNKIGLNIMLIDASQLSYQARLKITIEGQGILIKTKESMVSSLINLDYGTPHAMAGGDLSEYFDLANLDFVGYSKEAYLANGGLPEGQYLICFEVYDFDRSSEAPGSMPGCAVISAQVHDPPVILSPIDMQQTTLTQQLPIQWQPMHIGFPAEYTIEIYEFPFNTNLTADQTLANTQALITQNVMSITTSIVGPDDVLLDFGQRYLIQIQAADITMQNNFKNNGWSAPQIFYYGEVCPVPDAVSATVHDHSSATIAWNPLQGRFAEYLVKYRIQDTAVTSWGEEVASLPEVELTDLLAETTYEYQIQSECDGGFGGPFSPIYTFTTDSFPYEENLFDCGEEYDFPRSTNSTLLTNLKFGDRVNIGGFTMVVRSASGGLNGSWTGSGQVRLNWMQHMINVKFKNMVINTDYQALDGNAVAISEGLQSLPGFKTPKEIAAEDSLTVTTFCGDTISDDATADAKTFEDNFYATHAPSGSKHFVPYNAANPNKTVVKDELFYDPYDPYNSRAPYDPTDLSNPNNPYTEDNPYNNECIYNPYNSYNSYAPRDYEDPTNPYSAANPYDPKNLSGKCASASYSAFNTGALQGGTNLPLALGSAPNLIALDAMKFTPTGAVLNAYFTAKVPGTEKHIAFKMKNMEFHPGGISGEAKLQLAGDVVFNWKEKASLTFKGGKKSYVKFDCDGVTGISIQAQIQFCRDLMVPIDPATWARKTGDNYVTSSFTIEMPSWDEIATEISISPFEIPQLPDWAFIAQSVVVDFSDATTPKAVTFPRKYEHPDVNGLTPTGKDNPAWTGFYMKQFTVKLPEKFAPGKNHSAVKYTATIDTATGTMSIDSTKTPLTFNATDLLIDYTGFSGWIYGTNVLTMNDGSIDTWAFSIDSVGVGIKSNQFEKVAFAGVVKVPPLDVPLGYDCLVQPGTAFGSSPKYNFTVALKDSLVTPMSSFGAQLTLYKNSYIKVGYELGTGFGTAKLHGKASFNPNLSKTTTAQAKKDSFYIPHVAFQDFEVSTRAPYINNIGSWQYSSGGSDVLANFPLKINKFGMAQNKAQTEVAITIGAEINFMGADAQGFAASGDVSIICDVYKNDDGRHVWDFQRVRLNEFGIDVKASAFSIAGKLIFYEFNPIYGSGFQGQVKLTVAPKFEAAAVFQVGNLNGLRYWFADGLIAFNPGIAMGSSGLALYGFGGGVSYHMTRASFGTNTIKLPVSSAKGSTDQETGVTAADTAQINMPDIGVSLSGVKYVPSKDTGYGIKAMIALGTVTREVFNGDLGFEIILRDDGGVSSIGIQGEARMLTPPPTPDDPGPTPAIKAKVDMTFDLVNASFHADMKLYMSVAEGLIHGAYPYDVAGTGVIHADENDWYIHVGTPQKRIMISYDLTGLDNMARSDKNPPSYQGEWNEATRSYDSDSEDDEENSMLSLDFDNIGLLFTMYLDAGTVLPAFQMCQIM